jgi:glycosyltransferase involved in cell wall biosynthesis
MVREAREVRGGAGSARSVARHGLVIGIDAANLRRGGGRTHLTELLRAADPPRHGLTRVVVWGGSESLAALEDRPWLEKVNPPELDGGVLRRALWQRFHLSEAARESCCDVLFVPGGSFAGAFRPVVTMSRNMLPFEWRELRRYGWSAITLKLLLLRLMQTRSYRHADGVIFLTRYAREQVLKGTGTLKGAAVIIPHGLDSRFCMEPRPQRSIDNYSVGDPYRVLYVSIVDQYKHTWHVVEALAQLRRQTGWPVVLDLVGPAYPPALKRLAAAVRRFDPAGAWVTYHGAVPYADLPVMYAAADLAVFASSCENMPNILLECMAAGLPVACSDRGPMPEILGDSGVYFNPEEPADIAGALSQLIASPELRTVKAATSFSAAAKYSWRRCAADTFNYVAGIARHYRQGGRSLQPGTPTNIARQ